MSGENEATSSTTSETETPALIGGTVAETAEKKIEGVLEVTPQEQKKEGEAVEATKVEPLTADSIKIPEGMIADEALVNKFLEVMNNAELDPKGRSQALIDLQAEAAKAVSERGNKLWQDMQDTWIKDAHTQFGAALEPALGNISKLLDEYGGTPEQVKELRDVFTLTGAGNHPAMVRFLDNLGKPLREGSAKTGSPSGSQRSAAERLYPNMPKGDL